MRITRSDLKRMVNEAIDRLSSEMGENEGAKGLPVLTIGESECKNLSDLMCKWAMLPLERYMQNKIDEYEDDYPDEDGDYHILSISDLFGNLPDTLEIDDELKGVPFVINGESGKLDIMSTLHGAQDEFLIVDYDKLLVDGVLPSDENPDSEYLYLIWTRDSDGKQFELHIPEELRLADLDGDVDNIWCHDISKEVKSNYRDMKDYRERHM